MTIRDTPTGYQAICRKAARVYLRRQSGEEDPHGVVVAAGRWCPAPYERCDCCNPWEIIYLRPNFALKRHCCSLKHVAAIYELPLFDVRAALRKIRKGE